MKIKTKVKAKLIYAGGAFQFIDPWRGLKKFPLEQLKELVGGSIEIHKLPKEEDMLLVMNEDGKSMGLPVNKSASMVWQNNYPISEYPVNNDGKVVGDVLICPRKLLG